MASENSKQTHSFLNNLGEHYFKEIRKKTLWEEYIFDEMKEAKEKKIISKMKALESIIKMGVLEIPCQSNKMILRIDNRRENRF